jgi:choloylglycine hydrolase
MRPFKAVRLKLAALYLTLSVALGCSSVRVTSPDGNDVIGRTMELGDSPEWIARVHHKQQRMGGLTLCPHSASWENAFGFLSIDVDLLNASDVTQTEGMNEKGLTISCQTHREAVYPSAPGTGSKAICFADFAGWVLGNFATVADLKTALTTDFDIVGPDKLLPVSSSLFLHWAVDDAVGGHIVVEVIEGVLRIHNNTVGTMTNDPEYSWHLRNLNNFASLSPRWPTGGKGISVETEVGTVPQAVGHGLNLFGLPADFSPPSRFVKLFFLRQYAMLNKPPTNLNETIALATGILNSVFINLGTVAHETDELSYEYTQWSVLKLPQRKEFLLKDYNNQQWRRLRLDAIDFNKGAAEFSMLVKEGTLGVLDITPGRR